MHELFFDHPEASVTRVKEVDYFLTHFDKPVEWYLDQFQPTTSRTKVLVNMSPSGFGLPNVAARIRREIRNPYLLIGLRWQKYIVTNTVQPHTYRRGYVTARNALDRSVSFFFHSMSSATIPSKCLENYKADSDCGITNRPA